MWQPPRDPLGAQRCCVPLHRHDACHCFSSSQRLSSYSIVRMRTFLVCVYRMSPFETICLQRHGCNVQLHSAFLPDAFGMLHAVCCGIRDAVSLTPPAWLMQAIFLLSNGAWCRHAELPAVAYCIRALNVAEVQQCCASWLSRMLWWRQPGAARAMQQSSSRAKLLPALPLLPCAPTQVLHVTRL